MSEMLGQDVRYALRNLRRDRAYVAAVLLTLALGIGANTAVFSVVRAVLLAPLPYAHGQQLVVLRQPDRASGVEDVGFSVPEVQDYRTQSHTLDGVAEYHAMTFTLFGGPEPRRVLTGVVSADFFDVLAVKPMLGRTFRPGEDAIGSEALLVLSNEYWRSLGSDPGIVGRRFEMNDKVHTVIGVLPPLPQYPDPVDVYMPASACPFRSRPSVMGDRTARLASAFARVKPGTSLEQAQADVTALADGQRKAYPGSTPAGSSLQVTLTPLHEDLVRGARPTLLVLLATVALVLLIACANVANLGLARLSGRGRELAMRAALGATRLRILRQLVTESLVLSLAGGALGLVFAVLTQKALVGFVARFTPRAHEIHIDATVLLFTLGLSIVTGVVAGTLPGLPPMRTLSAALLASSGRATGGRRLTRLRSSLVVWQLAFSFVLLIGAALMLKSFAQLQAVDAGFRTDNVLTATLNLNFSRYAKADHTGDVEAIGGFFTGFEDGVRRSAGVTGVAEAWTFPLNTQYQNDGTFLIERRREDTRSAPKATYVAVSPAYFEVMGVPVLRGRAFDDHDQGTASDAAIVSASLARRWWSGEAIGERISTDQGKTWRTIVGVVGDVRQSELTHEPSESLYLPFRQFPAYGATVFVRARQDARALGEVVRHAAHTVDAQTAVSRVQTMTDIRAEALSQPRLTSLLLGLFAGVALLISAAGLSGLIAYSVSQRTREFGIRLALGAEPARVRRMVLAEGMTSVGIGLAMGLVGALGLARLVSGLLFGVAPTDPMCFVGSAIVLLGTAVLACALPARRATAIEPMRALRAD